jgi:hypothetical protein
MKKLLRLSTIERLLVMSRLYLPIVVKNSENDLTTDGGSESFSIDENISTNDF